MIPVYKPRGGSVESIYVPPPSYIVGNKWWSLVDTNDIVWVTNTGGYIEKYIPATLGTTIGDISVTATVVNTPTSDFTIGMATDGTYLYLISLNKTGVTKLTLDGTFVANFPLGSGLQSILFDGTNLWIGDSHKGLIYKINTSGTLLSTTIVNSEILSMTFDGTFIYATLFSANRVARINTSGSLVASFDWGVAPVGVAFDGNDLWVTLQSTHQYIYTGWVTDGGKLLKIQPTLGTITNTYTLSDALAYVMYFSATNTLGVTSTSDHTYKEVSLGGAVLTSSIIGLNPRNAVRDSYGYTYIAGYGDNTVFRVPMEGIVTPQLPFLLSLNAPLHSSASSTYLFVPNYEELAPNPTTITRVTLSDGTLTTLNLPSGCLAPFQTHFDGTNVWVVCYGISGTGNRFVCLSSTGTVLHDLTLNNNIVGVTQVGAFLYVYTYQHIGTIYKIDLSGNIITSNANPLVDSGNINSLTSDGTYLYANSVELYYELVTRWDLNLTTPVDFYVTGLTSNSKINYLGGFLWFSAGSTVIKTDLSGNVLNTYSYPATVQNLLVSGANLVVATLGTAYVVSTSGVTLSTITNTDANGFISYVGDGYYVATSYLYNSVEIIV